MLMQNKTLDGAWRAWLKENLERGCDPNEVVSILLKNGFALPHVLQSMGPRFAAGVSAIHAAASEPAKSAAREQEPAEEVAEMGQRRLDDAWKEWLEDNLRRHCDPEQLLGILLSHRFTLDSIAQCMGDYFPAASELVDEAVRAKATEPDYAAIAAPTLLRDQANLKRESTDKVQLYTLDNFLTQAECDAIVAIIDRRLRPSTVTIATSDSAFRTSRTCDLSTLNSPIVTAVDEKISKTLGIRPSYAEGNQAQRYEVGQQFKAHTDYFEPGTSEYAEHGGNRGNRTWTFMVYLNEGMLGGGTRFVALDKSFLPKKGQAVIWNNLYPDGTPNRDTLHSGEPVLKGHKIIITKWFRAKGSGPMFYDG
jgi:prolyl 4-hydroxylase